MKKKKNSNQTNHPTNQAANKTTFHLNTTRNETDKKQQPQQIKNIDMLILKMTVKVSNSLNKGWTRKS